MRPDELYRLFTFDTPSGELDAFNMRRLGYLLSFAELEQGDDDGEANTARSETGDE